MCASTAVRSSSAVSPAATYPQLQLTSFTAESVRFSRRRFIVHLRQLARNGVGRRSTLELPLLPLRELVQRFDASDRDALAVERALWVRSCMWSCDRLQDLTPSSRGAT